MVQENRFFHKQQYSNNIINQACDLIDILDESDLWCHNIREDIYRQIALVHLLVGFPNQNEKIDSEANIQINSWIIKLYEKIKEYRIKYHHGDI